MHSSVTVENSSFKRLTTIDAACVWLVCYALRGRSLEVGNSNLYQEIFLKCGFPFDNVSKIDNALRIGAGEQNDWCSL
jgi:hypothetical protein